MYNYISSFIILSGAISLVDFCPNCTYGLRRLPSVCLVFLFREWNNKGISPCFLGNKLIQLFHNTTPPPQSYSPCFHTHNIYLLKCIIIYNFKTTVLSAKIIPSNITIVRNYHSANRVELVKWMVLRRLVEAIHSRNGWRIYHSKIIFEIAFFSIFFPFVSNL